MKRFFQWLRGLFRRDPSHGPNINADRSEHNGRVARDRIRDATHPDFRDDHRPRTYHLLKGERRIGGEWAYRSPMHDGAWVLGYYIPSSRRCYTVCNPNDWNDYSDETERHEAAHDMEGPQLRLIPPWHYPKWRRLFAGWYNVPARTVKEIEPDAECCKKILTLPGVEEGDFVTVDYADGRAFACAACQSTTSGCRRRVS